MAKAGSTLVEKKASSKGTPIAAADRSPEQLLKLKANNKKVGAARKKQVDQIGRKLILTQFYFTTNEVLPVRMKNAIFRLTGLPELTMENGGVRLEGGKLQIVESVKTKSVKISYAMKNKQSTTRQKNSDGKVTSTAKKPVYGYEWHSIAVPTQATEADIIGWTSAFTKKPLAISVNGKILKFKAGADILSRIKKRIDTKSDSAK
jgi:hypothetical protein